MHNESRDEPKPLQNELGPQLYEQQSLLQRLRHFKNQGCEQNYAVELQPSLPNDLRPKQQSV